MTILVLSISVATAIVVIVNRTSTEDAATSSPINPTNTNPEDYKKCVEAGGEVNRSLAPSLCILDGIKYLDGNY